MDNVSVGYDEQAAKLDQALAFDNRGFECDDQIDRKEMESSTTSTLISGERPENPLLDSFISTTEDDQNFAVDQNILPAKLSIEATLCEQAESFKPAKIFLPPIGDSSEISDEELVEYPKCKEFKSVTQHISKISQANEDLLCISPSSQTDINVHLASSASAQTIPTSGSGDYLTCKSGATESSNVTSAASYITANDSTFHSETLTVSKSDSTLSSDSGTLVDERDTEQQENDYEELLDITPIKKIDSIEQLQQSSSGRIIDSREEEDENDSSSTSELLSHTIISNSFKEPYDTEIPKYVICDNSLNESFIKAHTIKQQEFQIFQPKQQLTTAPSSSSSKSSTKLSMSEQSDSSIETAIYKGDQNQSDFSSLESNADTKINQQNVDELEKEHIRDEEMPSIMAHSDNLDKWDESNLDDEMVIHHEYTDPQTNNISGSKKSSVDLYTLEEEEESRTEDALSSANNKLASSKDLKQQQFSSADNSSSLMEFERLEKELGQAETCKSERMRHSSLDSIGSISSTGALGTPKIGQQSENASVSSLNEFERLEKEFLSQEQQEQQQIKKQLTEIEEGHESQSETVSETLSGNSQLLLEREDDSEIELELNAKLDDYVTSCPSQQSIDLEETPKYVPQQTSSSVDKSVDEYDEEVLKIVKTTENRVIEELQSGAEIDTQFTMTTRTTKRTVECDDGETTSTQINTTITTTSSACLDEDELNKYFKTDHA